MAEYGYPLPDLRNQILSFKVTQLQDCAGRLGISKSGKKAEVQNRLLSYFGLSPVSGPGDISAAVQGKLESAARIIKDVYCHSKGIVRRPSSSPGLGPSPASGAGNGGGATTSAAAAAPPFSNGTTHLPSTKIKLHTNSNTGVNPGNTPGGKIPPGGVIRCFCRNTTVLHTGMIQCKEPSCGAWQHADCVGSAAITNSKSNFYCEQCRVHLADPFWRPLEQLLPVAKFKPTVGVAPIRDSYGDLHPQQVAEVAVYLSEQQLSRAKNMPDSERILASCLLIEDTVPCRLHWPRNVTMKVNRYPYRVYGRSTTSKMGINQRDEAASIASLCLAGRNTIDVQAVEGGTWLLLLHRAGARTVNQVKEMMLPEESLAESVSRVKKLMHDDAIAIASQIVSLIDPWSGQRMSTPARFIDASGLQAFDVDSFLSLAQRNRKWQDPTTLKNSTIRQLQVDKYIKTVLSCLTGAGGACLEVREIVINDEGKWKPEGSDVLSSSRWFSIEEDEEIVKKELAALSSSCGDGGSGNTENGAVGNTSTKASPLGAKHESEGVVLSDTESDDEEEELRKAASAIKNSAAQAALAGQKRKAESEPEPEVICLLSDSDDDNVPVGNGGGGGGGGGGGNRNAGAVNGAGNNAINRNPPPARGNNNNNYSNSASRLMNPQNPAYAAAITAASRGPTAAPGGRNRNYHGVNPSAQPPQNYPPKTAGYPYQTQGIPAMHPAALMNAQQQQNAGRPRAPLYSNGIRPSTVIGPGPNSWSDSWCYPAVNPPAYQQRPPPSRPMYNAARPPPPRPPPPRPPPPPPAPPAGGEAGRVLSQSAREALEETLAAIQGDPELMDQLDVDDWLN